MAETPCTFLTCKDEKVVLMVRDHLLAMKLAECRVRTMASTLSEDIEQYTGLLEDKRNNKLRVGHPEADLNKGSLAIIIKATGVVAEQQKLIDAWMDKLHHGLILQDAVDATKLPEYVRKDEEGFHKMANEFQNTFEVIIKPLADAHTHYFWGSYAMFRKLHAHAADTYFQEITGMTEQTRDLIMSFALHDFSHSHYCQAFQLIEAHKVLAAEVRTRYTCCPECNAEQEAEGSDDTGSTEVKMQKW